MSNTKKNKIYLIAEKTMDGKIKFRTHDNRVYGYWAGGNEQQPKFIIKALVQLYGPVEGAEIYQKFMGALLAVQDLGEFNKKTACITLYENESQSE